MNRLAQFTLLIALWALGSATVGAAQRPIIETAVIDGIMPGVTTNEELTRLWGDPRLESIHGNEIIRLYSMEPLNHIEVTLRGGLVRSIVIELEMALPEIDVRDSLSENLLRSKPVLIPDEAGNLLGQIFPERGVIFMFSPESTLRELYVERIVVEPVSAEPFVIRAEAVLYNLPSESKQDLMNAVQLNPNHARAHWLLAQIALWEGRVETAVQYIERAIQQDEQRPAYHLTFAQALVQMNRIDEAKQYLQETIAISDRFPHERARALLLLGELYRTSRHPDHELALACHEEAIHLATTLFNHNNPTIRLTARDVLFESHLAAAKVIAWGHWDLKEESINMWLDRARMLASDPELMRAQRYSREHQFKIAATALATLVALPDKTNIEGYIENVIEAGNELIRTANDPILHIRHYWDTGVSLYDAMQIFQIRRQFSAALRYGELAADYMEVGLRGRNSDTDWYLLGRLYFRLGAIHAIGNDNHRAAIEWYDRALPIFERLLPKIDVGALGPFGETLVSMGMSYWMTGQQERAIALTETGLRQLERGVRERVLDVAILEIPYLNLAKMYHDLRDHENAARYMRLASAIKADERMR